MSPWPLRIFQNICFKISKAFGYSTEDIETILKPMALDGKPIGSMGFRCTAGSAERSAAAFIILLQTIIIYWVTNPPIDPIRKEW